MSTDNAEKIHEELVADAEKYVQRYLETELTLWTAILTLNGLIISAASVMTAMMEGYWLFGFLFSITLSLYSSILVFRNLNRRRYLYGHLKLVPSVETIRDDAKFQKYLDASQDVRRISADHERQNKRDENMAVSCLALSTLGLLVTVYTKFVFL